MCFCADGLMEVERYLCRIQSTMQGAKYRLGAYVFAIHLGVGFRRPFGWFHLEAPTAMKPACKVQRPQDCQEVVLNAPFVVGGPKHNPFEQNGWP